MSDDENTLYDKTSDNELADSRPSEDLSDIEHDILESEDERERLLTGNAGRNKSLREKGLGLGRLGRSKDDAHTPKVRSRKTDTESSALMYEMEEGVGIASSSMSRGSSESDNMRLQAAAMSRKSRKSRVFWRILAYGAITCLLLVLLFGAYRLSKPKQPVRDSILKSNGTSLFAPTTILISLDGFRADFLQRGLTPTLNKFIAEGVSPKYMLPSFPSVTFPNHYTMATGLYPEAHGIVGNTFWDPAQKKEFYYTDPKRSLQSTWWGGEPIWRTAERQGIRVAIHMWPGSEVHEPDFAPKYVDKYNGSEILPKKIDRIMELLDTPGPMDLSANSEHPRPQLIAAYVPNVDADGHQYGPNSTEIRQTVSDADTMLKGILEGLQQRNLTEVVNVVVVSDHGMATTDTSRLIQLEDLVDPNELEHIDGWPHYGLRPKRMDQLDRLHEQILNRAQNMSSIEVYRKDRDMPERYHFSNNNRIAPLWIIPKAGWAVIDRSAGDVIEMQKNGDVYHPRGIHGYDHEHPLMRAIFVARGPAFPHQPNSRVEPFQNIELYNIICDSLHIDPASNNGTLRLPFKPVGFHDDSIPDLEVPSDPVDPAMTPTLPSSAITSVTEPSLAGETPSPTSTAAPEVAGAAAEAAVDKAQSFWEWLSHKADEAKEWLDGLVHKDKPSDDTPP